MDAMTQALNHGLPRRDTRSGIPTHAMLQALALPSSVNPGRVYLALTCTDLH